MKEIKQEKYIIMRSLGLVLLTEKDFAFLCKREFLRGYISGADDKNYIYDLKHLNTAYKEYLYKNKI